MKVLLLARWRPRNTVQGRKTETLWCHGDRPAPTRSSWTVDSSYKKLFLPAWGRGDKRKSHRLSWNLEESRNARVKHRSGTEAIGKPIRQVGPGPMNSVHAKIGSEACAAVFWVFCCCLCFWGWMVRICSMTPKGLYAWSLETSYISIISTRVVWPY